MTQTGRQRKINLRGGKEKRIVFGGHCSVKGFERVPGETVWSGQA